MPRFAALSVFALLLAPLAEAKTAPAQAASASFNLGPHIIGISHALTFIWTENKAGSQPYGGESTGGGGLLVGGGGSIDDVPRIGFDGRANSWLTMGLDLVIGTKVRSVGTGSFAPSTDGAFVLGVSPRLGGILPLGDGVALWPRFGLSFLYLDSGSGDFHRSSVRVPLNLELLMVMSPFAHLGFTFGAGFDPLIYQTDTTLSWHLALFGGMLAYW